MSSNGLNPIGNGIYEVSEVARYTGVHPSTVRSWFWRRGKNDPLFHADYPPVDGQYTLSFFNLIESLVAGKLRSAGFSSKRMRVIHSLLESELGTPHPFCLKTLWTDGHDIFSSTGQAANGVEGVLTRQAVFQDLVRPVLEEVEFDEQSGLARRWHISPGVVIDPARNFGKPILKDSGITTYVVANNYMANRQRANFVGELFDIPPEQVNHAVEFSKAYGELTAA